MPSKKTGYSSYIDYRPKYKSTQRITMPQIAKRPIRFQIRSIIRHELVKGSSPWWFSVHRRGLFRQKVGQNPLEARAVPHGIVPGYLPERILYATLVNLFHFVPGVDFLYQCLAGHHKVLTTEMRWIPISELKVGDKLLSMSEHSINGKHRTWETGTVLYNEPTQKEAYNVYLSNGQVITCTAEHPWLVHYDAHDNWSGERARMDWVVTSDLRIGMYVPKFLDVWEENTSKESGYVAGFFDGEGSVIHGKTASGGHAITVTVAQNHGDTLDEFVKNLHHLGFEFSTYDYSGQHRRSSTDDRYRNSVHFRIKGGRAEALRFLGTVRPAKLSRLDISRLGKVTKKEDVIITKIEPAGMQIIYQLSVDKKTYLAEGFGMHNSSMDGGRLALGGLVADFLFPYLRIVINPLGPQHYEFRNMKKDEEQLQILAEMGYQAYMIDQEVILDEFKLEDFLRRVFTGLGSGGGDEGGHPADIATTQEDDQNASDDLVFAVQQLQDNIYGIA